MVWSVCHVTADHRVATAIQANGIAYIGWSNTPANGVLWTQVFTAKNPPTAADINAADVRNNFAARMGVPVF